MYLSRKVLLPLLTVGVLHLAGPLFGMVAKPINEREVDVVWSSSDGRRVEIFYAHKKEGSWTEPIRITDDYYDNMYPVIDRDSTGKRWVFWTAYDNGNMELRYTTGENEDWRDGETLADDMKTNIAPSVIIDKQDTVWVVWSANDGDLDDIYYAFNENDSWSQPDHLHDRNGVPDMLPEIELDGAGTPQVSWKTLKNGITATLMSRWTEDEWSDPEVRELAEANSKEDETLELPSFVRNGSMVFVRVY